MNQEIEVMSSSGNIFADLGLVNCDELLVKAELVHQISNLITAKNLTQAEAATLFGLNQPEISALLQGKLSDFSTEHLFRFLNALGSDVEIRVIRSPQSGSQAKTTIVSV
jgi:predicted XRE-type DNA-binding protein